MADKDTQKELEQLRAEVAALSAARASKQAAVAQSDTAPIEQQPPETDELSGILENAKAAVADDAELKGQFDQLFEQLEQEIRDLPAITTLAVFSLGVLFGRLLR
jgi:hypothetical protein